MLKIIRDKKGSIAIFLAMIITTMFIIATAFVDKGKELCQDGFVNDVGFLAGRSVLSEYNVYLKDHYGLMCFAKLEGVIMRDLTEYMDYSFRVKESLKLEDLSVSTSNYSMTNLDVFKKEVLEYVKYLVGKDPAGPSPDGKALIDGRRNISSSRSGILRNRAVINSLPSNLVEGQDNVIDIIKDNIENIDKVFEKTGENFLLSEYIMRVFNDGAIEKNKDSFFANEVEYIISGNKSDTVNFKKAKRKIILIRNIFNLMYIKSDPALMSKIATAAAFLTPGPAAAATEIALMEALALAEARNDFKMLAHGKKVPLRKTKELWAIDLESIVGDKKQGYVDVSNGKGLDYEDYLRVLLYFTGKEKKLLRMMDLMQINVQCCYDDTFLMSHSAIGFDVNFRVNGRNYVQGQRY